MNNRDHKMTSLFCAKGHRKYLLIALLLIIAAGLFIYYKSQAVNLLTAYSPTNPDNTFNAVIEIPAGTQAKWEVNKDNGRLQLESVAGKPRIINYLAYPFNYGFIPRTLLPKELGGDGDAIDVLVLGNTIPRGTVVKVNIIALLKLLDKNEIDDKLIAVPLTGPMSQVNTLAELKRKYPGVIKIIKTWFKHYKKKGKIKINGVVEAADAKALTEQAAENFNHY